MSPKSASTSQNTRLLEAILFIAERPVSIEEIQQSLHIHEEGDLEKIIKKLRENLEKRNSFIEILKVDQEQAVQMQISPTVKKELDVFRIKKTMSKELMQTLAYVALKQPLKYSELRQFRGTKVKEHIEKLEREGYINITPSGRPKVLSTTLYFASVFNLDPDRVKDTFKDEIKKRMLDMIQNQ